MDHYPILKPLNDVLDVFDQRSDGFDIFELSSALQAARAAIDELSEAEFKVAANDLMAFQFQPYAQGSPWGTRFGPLATLEGQDGQPVYSPDKAWLDGNSIAQWRERATELKHPLLKARYADLVWDLGPQVEPEVKRDGKMGKLAAVANVEASGLTGLDLIYAYQAAQRGLTLAIALNNGPLRDKARAAVLALHARSRQEGGRHHDAYDILTSQPKSGLTDQEHAQFIADLEADLTTYSDTTLSGPFDPHRVQSIAERLIAHYRSKKQPDDERRVHLVVAQATEHFAGLGNAMLASSILNETMVSYKNAGRDNDAERIRRLMQEKVREANSQMTAIRHEMRITFDQVEAFKAEIVVDDPALTLARIAFQFLLKRNELEGLVEQEAKAAPLQAHLTQSIMGEKFQVASVGATEDDPYGRVMRQATMALQVKTPWLGWAFEAAMDRHKFELQQFAGWSNRAGLFGDGMLLCSGIEAWLNGDDLKAIHVLIPQIERALRNLVEVAGRPATKPHPRFGGAHTVITMGEIVYTKDTIAALGERGQDLAVHIAALYADPRGMNLRNELAHGLLDWRQMHPGTMLWIIHTLLVLGMWRSALETEAWRNSHANMEGV